MIVRTCKNGNAHIRREDESFETLGEFIDALVNTLELNVVSVREFEAWGNCYGVYPVEVNGPAGQYVYEVGLNDMELFNAGRRVVLQADREYPLFDVPKYYDFREVTLDGIKCTLYKLCKPLTDEAHEYLKFYGCKVFYGSKEYAPEIKYEVLAVPHGVSHWFE